MTDENYSHLLLIVDRSGSMSHIASDMNGGIQALLKEQAALPGEIVVDAWTFDSTVDQVVQGSSPDNGVLAELVQPRGMTAMFDGIGTAVNSLGAYLSGLEEIHRPGKVLVVIVTDGHENASREFTQDQVKGLLTDQQEKYGWQVVFLGANIDAAKTAGGIGLRSNSSHEYVANTAGVQNAWATTSSLMADYRTGVSRSMVYTPDPVVEPEPEPEPKDLTPEEQGYKDPYANVPKEFRPPTTRAFNSGA